MTDTLLSLFGYSTRSVPDREPLARRALLQVERSLRGEGALRRTVEDLPAVGTATRCVSHHFPGPRGGKGVVVRMMGMDLDGAASLSLARNALECLLSPSWSRNERERVGATATALGLLAHDVHPDATLCAGFTKGPCGPARSEWMTEGATRSWIGVPLGEEIQVADTPDGVLIDLEKPRDHGRIALAVTLSQVRMTVRREWAMHLNAVERLRYAQLARRA